MVYLMKPSREGSRTKEKGSKGYSKVNILEGVISGHTEPCEGNSISIP